MGPGRFELPTSRLSGVRSNQLSYEPRAISISDFRLTILIKKSQIGNRKPTILPGSSVINIYLKKSNKKNRCSDCQRPKTGQQRLSVSSSEQDKRSQNLFQNPNQILSFNGLVHSSSHTQIPNILRYRHIVNTIFKYFFLFSH